MTKKELEQKLAVLEASLKAHETSKTEQVKKDFDTWAVMLKKIGKKEPHKTYYNIGRFKGKKFEEMRDPNDPAYKLVAFENPTSGNIFINRVYDLQ